MTDSNGWTLTEPAPRETIAIIEPDELPRTRKGFTLYTMPESYPWDLPARKVNAVTGGRQEVIEPVPVDLVPMSGSIGTITSTVLHTGTFKPDYVRMTKYGYSLQRKRNNVVAVVWKRVNGDQRPTTFYMYTYDSARHARVDMKKHNIKCMQ